MVFQAIRTGRCFLQNVGFQACRTSQLKKKKKKNRPISMKR
eukprot:CAMPEP_0195026822 /NCGR_PEP_ID=MMETSP0326_2-20130528/51099_1 /TAXON_ID=2866 ORGANISM="Crypthecodinium cohnii, Strain Seligo" /NCGR_SAMPLE_ID=MMETSP0326_2 /ASSEMBLY_ACC=CAM_ASM_000348 /LENGTH=40 /DNA_ID= /DNA_START= /DNA_END= /DNA_ORIENTATION=